MDDGEAFKRLPVCADFDRREAVRKISSPPGRGGAGEDQMQKAGMAALGAAMMLAGCGAANVQVPLDAKLVVNRPEPLTPQQIKTIEAAVREKLKDPDSARFGVIVAGRNADNVILVCGLVNAKNSYGGYTGMGPFTGEFRDANFRVTALTSGGDQEVQAIITGICRRQGLKLD